MRAAALFMVTILAAQAAPFASAAQDDAGLGQDAPNEQAAAASPTSNSFSGAVPAEPMNFDRDWYRVTVPAGTYARVHVAVGSGQAAFYLRNDTGGFVAHTSLQSGETGTLELWWTVPAILLEVQAGTLGHNSYSVVVETPLRPDVRVVDLIVDESTGFRDWDTQRYVVWVVRNDGPGTAHDVLMTAETRNAHLTTRVLATFSVSLLPGEERTFRAVWDQLGQVGSFQVQVTALSWPDLERGGQVARKEHHVLAPAPLGVDALNTPRHGYLPVHIAHEEGIVLAEVMNSQGLVGARANASASRETPRPIGGCALGQVFLAWGAACTYTEIDNPSRLEVCSAHVLSGYMCVARSRP